MNLLYTKPILKDLSQGSRISYIRQLRNLTQDDVSDMLHLTGESKRRTMTRYEINERSPKEDRLKELSKILLVSDDFIKQYDYKNELDIIYFLLWLDELFPNLYIELNTNNKTLNDFLMKWNEVKQKRKKRIITFEEYIEWKFSYRKEV